MNAHSARCSDESLWSLLRSDDDSDELQRFAQHVDECPRCQTRLERLAAEPSEWSVVKDSLVSSGTGDELTTDELDQRPWAGHRWHRHSTSWNDSMARQLLAPPSHPEMLGRIGRYEVERLIGAGGMGVVFKAFDTELNRPVAVKVLAPYLAGSGAARQRFAREARAAAAIVHEHVVAIHNVESDGESPFLVMQFVAGESLQQRIDRQGPLELCEILRIALQTASGLAAAHAQGLVHRDVKPSNILLEQGIERALLTDFGLARASDDASLTHTGYHPGTPQYMSPEQARGESVDARSDLFSLGSVLYTMCTGRPPFRAETSYGILRRITDNEPRSILEINPAIPVWLQRLVAQLHAKAPAQRIGSAEEARDLLEQCLAHVQQPTTAQLPSSLDAPKPSLSLAALKQHLATSVKALKRRPRFSLAMLFAAITMLGVAMGFLQWRASGLRHLNQGIAWAESLGGHGTLIDDGRFLENHGLRLNLEHSGVQDADLLDLAAYRDIHSLDLEGTAITDEGLHHLATCRGLEYLDLRQTAVTRAGIDQLVSELGYAPQIRMPVSGFYDPSSPGDSPYADTATHWEAVTNEIESFDAELSPFENRSKELWNTEPSQIRE